MVITDETAETFRLIWIDETMNKNDDTRKSQEKLRALVNALMTYNNIDDAIAAIKVVKEQRILLIVSGRLAKELLEEKKIQDLKQLDSIYIFCKQHDAYQDLLEKDPRIREIFTNIDFLCERLKKDTKRILNNMLLFSVSPSKPEDESKGGQEEEKVKFLCSQLHRDLLFTMEYSDSARGELIQFCQDIYRANPSELRLINDLLNNYHTGKAVWWYENLCIHHSESFISF